MELIHVPGPSSETSLVRVVFVHGLDGHPYLTWKAKVCANPWFVWLMRDFNGIAAYTLGYDAGASGWRGNSWSLEEAGKELARLLVREAGDGKPLVFICHSLGGLIVKQALVTMAAGLVMEKEVTKPVLDSVRAVIFYGTPHGGSMFANLAGWLRWLVWPTATMSYLARGSQQTGRLNEEYRNWVRDTDVRTVVIYETRSTLYGTIVQRSDHDPGIPGASLIPSPYDHFQICKPTDREDQRYSVSSDVVGAFTDRVASPTAPTDDPVVLPPVRPRSKPVILHVLFRAVLLLFVGYVAFRGLTGIYDDAFQDSLLSAAERAGASSEEAKQTSDRIIADLQNLKIGEEPFAEFVRKHGLPLSTSPNQLYDNVIKLAKDFNDVQKQLDMARKQDTPDTQEVLKPAEKAFDAGELAEAQRLLKSSALKQGVAANVEFTTNAERQVVYAGDWDKENIVPVEIPQLAELAKPAGVTVLFHRKGTAQLRKAFDEVEAAGLLPTIEQWCGSFVPRTLMTTKILSAHALGLAFDINCDRASLAKGKIFSPQFMQMVKIFEDNGFVWGGRYSRPDNGHFQLYEFRSPLSGSQTSFLKSPSPT